MTSWNSSDDAASAEPAGEAELAGRMRSRVSRERREELLAEFDRSGVSAPRFAERAGVRYSTFAGWLHRRRQEERAQGGSAKRQARGTAGAIAWLEAVAERPEAEGGPLRVSLPGGAWMEPGTAEQLRLAAVLLRELENAGGPAC